MSTRLAVDAQEILKLLPDAALLVQADGLVCAANAHAESLFGYKPDALLGQPIESLLPEQFRAAHRTHRTQFDVAMTPRPMGTGLELLARRSDASDVRVDVSLSPFACEQGQLVLACVRDMTEHARLVSTLRERDEWYRLVVETGSEVIYRLLVNGDPLRGSLEFVSPQCERLTGRTPQEFLDDPNLWMESIHPDDKAAVFETVHRILTQRVEASGYYRIRKHPTGEYRWVADRAVPLLDREGRVVGYQGTARDITDSRHAEEERQRLSDQLRQAQKMEAIGRLAGGVAHDFNNMLTVILGSCDSALLDIEPGNPARRDLEEIADAGKRAASLTHRLLAFSRKQAIAPRVLDVNAHLKTLTALVRRTISENIDIAFSFGETLWPVCIDPGQLDQVVLNLAVNARDAMPAGGSLTLQTMNVTLDEKFCKAHAGFLPGEYVQLSLKDTGCGMDPDTLMHAFEPFFTTKPQGQGTGLGLASVYGIVKQNHGFIQVDSGLDRGTTVDMYLPRSRGDEHKPSAPPKRAVPGGHETVLLVEDNDRVRLVTRRLLERLGYNVLEAASPAAALALCATHESEIHLLLTDLVMPQKSGVELSEEITVMKPGMHVLLMSGYAADVLPGGSQLREGMHYLQKPFEQSSLASAVRHALDAAS